MADIKLIALDLDGTTLNSKKEITPRTRAAIDAALAKGVRVALASGRSLRGVLPTAKLLELEKKHGLIVAWTGAYVEDLTSHELLHQRTLPPDIVPELCAYAKAHDMAIMTYDREGMSISETPEDQYIVYEAVSNGIPQRKVEDLNAEVTYPLNKMLLTFHPSRLAELEPQMQAHFAGRIDVYHSEPYFLEAMPLGCTKATALEMLLDKLGLSRENLMVCGDSGNDLAMIRFAGLGVAMGNADEDVKAQADFVSTSNDEDGVAVAIEKFVLGRAECL